jgi:hypothetical protein
MATIQQLLRNTKRLSTRWQNNSIHILEKFSKSYCSLIASVISSGHADVFLPVVYHAVHLAVRRYTLYVPSGCAKAKWREVLMDAMDVQRARMEVNRVNMLLPFVSPTSWVTCTTVTGRRITLKQKYTPSR